ncbi:MAG: T9SS type A sorting domain-containing protein [Bacteroidales bacterium]|nr:T9SS type A sorting domain-containing protein [Bacteroidales bacterium]
MKHNLSLYQWLLAFLIANFSFLTAYPQGEWKWAHSWTGSGGSYTQIFNQITNTAFDEEGNIYVYGSMGGNPEMDGQHFLTDVPSEVSNGAIPTILLAKFDTLGNMLWYKIVKCNHNSNPVSTPLWMEVRNRKVCIAGTSAFWGSISYTSWLYYMDTLVRKSQLDSIPEAEQKPPYKIGSRWTFFAQFDLDGNLLEDHFVEAYSRQRQISGSRIQEALCIHEIAPVHVDSHGNTYVYTFIEYGGSEDAPYTIVVDGDTNKTYDIYLPGTVQQGSPLNYLFNAMVYKFSPNWELVYAKRVVDKTDGIVASWEYLGDSINPYYYIYLKGLSIDEEDNMYLSGYLTLPMYDYETGGHLHQYPIHIWWDSTHCATIQDMSGAYRTNFIIKYDTNGRVRWCNQIYTKGNSVETPYARAEWRRNCINDDYIYIIGDAAYTPNSYANIYFDTENDSLRRFVPCDSGIGFFVRYDKRTGRYVSHGIVPAENVLTCLTPAVIQNRVFMLASFNYESTCMFSELRNDGYVIRVDTINTSQPKMRKSQGVIANSDGSLLLSLTSFSPVTFSDNVVANCNPGSDNAVFALYKNPEWAKPFVGIAGYGEKALDLRLWPNPANGIIYVEGGRPPMDYITVTDLNGRTLKRETVRSSSATIDISRLPAGTYILEAVSNGEVSVEKFVKAND